MQSECIGRARSEQQQQYSNLNIKKCFVSPKHRSTGWRISGQSSKAKVRDTAPDESTAPGQTEKLGVKNQPTSLVTSSESGSTPPAITTTCLAPDTSGTSNNRLSVMSGAPGNNEPGKKTAAGRLTAKIFVLFFHLVLIFCKK